MGKHSKVRRRRAPQVPPPKGRRLIEMVDARTLLNHLLTQDAAAEGRRAPYRYLALCGRQILPAALVEPGTGYCRSCWHYFRRGYPMPSWLFGMFDQLTRTGLLALAEQDSAGLRRVSLTPAGQLRDQQLTTLPPRAPNPAHTRLSTSCGSSLPGVSTPCLGQCSGRDHD